MSPSQATGDGAVPATGVIVLPQKSVTVGGAGTTMLATQLAVAVVLSGILKSGTSMVTVCDHTCELPAQSVYVQE